MNIDHFLFATFEELQDRLQDLYQQGLYAEALELATLYNDRFPDDRSLLNYWRTTMAARAGNLTLAISLLREILETGFWYAEVLLRKSPSFQPLQGRPEFEELVALNRQLQTKEQQQLFPLLTLRAQGQCQSIHSPCPLMIALHSNTSTAQATVNFWRVAALHGWLVAVPQSSQAMWKGAYSWNDRQIAEEEVHKHYTNLTEQYAIDLRRTVLAGHSMGGEVAIWLALTGAIPAQGFIAFGPGGPFMDKLENWDELLRERAARPLRGYLIMGQQDTTIPQDNLRAFSKLLNDKGIPCQVEEVPGTGHDFVPEFEASLLRGLAFIEQR